MVDLKNIQPGVKVKSKLYAISCATGEKNKQVEWKHWWTVAGVGEEVIEVVDNKENKMFFDRSGRGLEPNKNHFIYKVK